MKLKTQMLIGFLSVSGIGCLLLIVMLLQVYVKDRIELMKDQVLQRSHQIAEYYQEVSLDPANLQLKRKITEHDWIRTVIFQKSGKLVVADSNLVAQNLSDFVDPVALQKISKGASNEGVVSSTLGDKIYSFSFIPQSEYGVLSFVTSKNFFRIGYLFALRIIGSLLVVLTCVWIMVEYFSVYFTKNLNQVKNFLQEYGKGNLEQRIPVLRGSKSEFSELASSFNKMADQIQSHVKAETRNASKLNELKMTNRIQKSLLPEQNFGNSNFSLSSYYEAASDCGGDWWHYELTDSGVVLFIADVSGHGASSAMLTSSCRSLVALLFEQNQNISPNEVLDQLNKAIFKTVQGDLNATMLVLAFDFKLGTLTYSNASHEFPYFWKQDQKLSTQDNYNILLETHGPRLGQDPKHSYGQNQIPIPAKSRWILFTDGTYSIANEKGKSLDDKGMLKKLIQIHGAQNIMKFQTELTQSLAKFRGQQPLDDDLTFVCLDILG